MLTTPLNKQKPDSPNTPIKNKGHVKIPKWAICPITDRVMVEPVICEHGYSFERAAFYHLHREYCPCSQQPRTRIRGQRFSEPVNNLALQQAIAFFNFEDARYLEEDKSPLLTLVRKQT